MSAKRVTAKIAWAIERWWSEKTATQAELLDRIDAIIRERDQYVALQALEFLEGLEQFERDMKQLAQPGFSARQEARRRIETGQWKPPSEKPHTAGGQPNGIVLGERVVERGVSVEFEERLKAAGASDAWIKAIQEDRRRIQTKP